jgi:succinate dehydrogenase/fumarate reductase flavoprotein subunit
MARGENMEHELQDLKTIATDVLVVGGGGAGFRAAIGAREKGVRAILISKGLTARSGASPMAGADLTCHGRGMRAAGFFGEPRDSEEKFLSDILHHGFFLNDQKLAELYIKGGPDRMLEMIQWGVKPTLTDERAVNTTGTAIMDALRKQAKSIGVEMMEDIAIIDLLLQGGEIAGALGLDLLTGQFIQYRCKAVVIATGGWHKAYTPVTGSRDLSGDGIAMAYRAGAQLTNMEFVTFACNVIYWPPAYSGSIMTYIMGEMYGGSLENSENERIFDKYDPWMIACANRTEWNKSFFSNISAREMRAGKSSPHGGVFYRVGDEPYEQFEKKVMVDFPDWMFKGNDMSFIGEKLKSGEGVEVGPGAEYFEGGIAVDEHYATNLPGLYAAGESASSLFGANRVAAATMEMLTTGALAGWSAGQYALHSPLLEPDPDCLKDSLAKALQPFERKEGVKPSEIRRRIQETSQEKMGPIRNENEIKEFLSFLDTLKLNDLPHLYAVSKSRRYNKSWVEALEIENMVTVLGLSAQAALARPESRGVHFREDFPVTDNENWLKEIVLQRNGEKTQMSLRSFDQSIMTPPKGILPYFDMLKMMMKAHSDIGGAH